jgi:hypothetical protein
MQSFQTAKLCGLGGTVAATGEWRAGVLAVRDGRALPRAAAGQSPLPENGVPEF